MIEIFKEFTFEAAHHLGARMPSEHPYGRIHGHSFHATVALRGTPDPKTGWLMDFAELEAILDTVHEQLDHRFLNDIRGLEQPTLETLTRWIWDKLKPQLPLLARVTIRRGSLGNGCTYEGN